MSEVEIHIKGKTYKLPVITGTDGKEGIDLTDFYRKTGLVTVDPGLFNTALGLSKVSRRDPEKGELTYRGYDLKELAYQSTFVETSFLLIYGNLPTKQELNDFSSRLSKHSMIHEDMLNLFDGFPGVANPLAVLSVMVTSLSSYYLEEYEEKLDMGVDLIARLLAKIRTIAAFTYKHAVGHPFVYPLDKNPYCTNFLYMMHKLPADNYNVPEEFDRILNQMWILHADHEQNVSNTAVQVVGSTQANLFASISAGIMAQWGAREGGRPTAAIGLIEDIIKTKTPVKDYFERFKRGGLTIRTNGFGQKAYDVVSPRAQVAREIIKEFYKNRKLSAVEDVALQIDEVVWNDSYFMENLLYPNLEYYSGLVFHTLGIPKNMFSVMQVIGRLPGWLAHWREQRMKGDFSKVRPKQIYVGENQRKYIPIANRL
ncbi:citrate synthase [Leptospira levettii]|uniref:Citrate synthase n=1 Tax=Leptospira levettii TaxID=2023178 RepID=A0AAW5V6C9_9LEPT|nr:citrate/2-methylcitrate synthase [Leptospira levettii]MCW7466813.1 citrate synthase [Leptospira levettii]MCW7497527.1 citrate synthase [Leptospira levettii]MCW7512536.1 citrate synthase [Leptospira levettii]MCW7515970.1 citrate synthase [Leptospira levettii]